MTYSNIVDIFKVLKDGKNEQFRREYKRIKGFIRNIYSILRNILNEQIGCADELEKVRNKLKNLYATISMIDGASNSLSSTIRKNEELLSFGLSLSNEILKKIKIFLQITDTLNQRLKQLIGKREEINSIVEKLLGLSQTSANTARNAEIKAYQAGSQGKGFEVVATELGELTGESLSIVDAMVLSLETLRDESKKIVDRFKTLQDKLSKFEGITQQLETNSNELRDKFSLIIDTTDRLIELLERMHTKREEIDLVANSLLYISKNFLLKAWEINLILAQKESVSEIVEHFALLHQHLKDKNSHDLER